MASDLRGSGREFDSPPPRLVLRWVTVFGRPTSAWSTGGWGIPPTAVVSPRHCSCFWHPRWVTYLNSWKRYSVGLLVLLNETTDQQHRCLLSFLNLAGKPSLIVGETVAYHSCTRVFTVWLVFPPRLFVVLPSPLVQLMATHFVSCPLEPILTSTPSILVPLLTGMPSRHLWSLVLPFIRSAVRYIPAWSTSSNHTPIPAVTAGNPWPAITEEQKNDRWRQGYTTRNYDGCITKDLKPIEQFIQAAKKLNQFLEW